MMDAFFQLRKVDEEKRLVHGRFSQSIVDRSGEMMDWETGRDAIMAWSQSQSDASNGKSLGNVRSQHQKNAAAGRIVSIDVVEADKAIDGVVEVVDDQDWAKVQKGVYTGFSIGGGYARRWTETSSGAAIKMYTPRVEEISLVDRPCVQTAGFYEVVKCDGTTEQRGFSPQGDNMSEDAKAGESVELKKGLWEGKRFLSLLEEARWLQTSLADEKVREGDASMVPEDLKVCLGMIAELAEKYIGEQLAELKAGGAIAVASEAGEAAAEAVEAEKAASVDLTKAARTGKKAAREQIAAASEDMHKLCKAYLDLYGKADGDEDDAEKAVGAEDLAKSAESAPDVEDMIRRAVADAVRPFEGMLTKFAPVAPATRAPNLRALDKDADASLSKADSLDDLRKAAESDGPDAVRASIKLAFTNPTIS